MNRKRPGLGRGLDALLSRTTNATTPQKSGMPASAVSASDDRAVDDARPQADLHHLPVEAIARNPWQPRRHIDDAALEELATSIRNHGVVQPIAVRRTPAARLSSDQPPYELIAGERRWRAAQRLGLKTIPAVIHDIDDRDAAAVALIENIQREDLNPLEESQALHRLIEEFGLTHQAVADAIGRSRAAVTNLLRLMQLAPRVQAMLRDREIEMGHARALLGLPENDQPALAERAVLRGWNVRQIEAAVRERLATQGENPQPTLPKDSPAAPGTDHRDLERRLAERLGAATKIRPGSKGRGKIVIEYNSLDELDGLIERIGV
ncbi:MAG: ParB/RepB/Spo0J family partition protein [Thioalkalivibrionaceae bacterium]